jgi:hypothetical protein
VTTGTIARFALAAVLFGGGAAFVATSAGAAPVPETGESGILWLEADPYPVDAIEIEPGESVLWPVTAHLDATESGDLTLEVSAAEPLATDDDGLVLLLSECDVPWDLPADPSDGGVCAGAGATTVIDETPFADAATGQRWNLGLIAPGVPRYFLATLSLPSALPGELAGESAEIGFGFRAGGGSAGGGLAETGASLVGPLLLGSGILLAGVTARSLRGRP